MKIAFIGSHGVGKTTLCYDLAARLKRQDRAVDLVKEAARRCPLPIIDAPTFDGQRDASGLPLHPPQIDMFTRG